MKTKHTPGPWKAQIINGKPNILATKPGGGEQMLVAIAYQLYQGEEDARLIAAAPELVAALEDCRKWLDSERAACKAETLEELLTAARAALEKAGRGVEGGGE